MPNPRLLTVGTINGGTTSVQVDMSAPDFRTIVAITLTTDYAMLVPDGAMILGFPVRPSFAGTEKRYFPQTLSSGQTFNFHKCEADALIGAGAGVAA